MGAAVFSFLCLLASAAASIEAVPTRRLDDRHRQRHVRTKSAAADETLDVEAQLAPNTVAVDANPFVLDLRCTPPSPEGVSFVSVLYSDDGTSVDACGTSLKAPLQQYCAFFRHPRLWTVPDVLTGGIEFPCRNVLAPGGEEPIDNAFFLGLKRRISTHVVAPADPQRGRPVAIVEAVFRVQELSALHVLQSATASMKRTAEITVDDEDSPRSTPMKPVTEDRRDKEEEDVVAADNGVIPPLPLGAARAEPWEGITGIDEQDEEDDEDVDKQEAEAAALLLPATTARIDDDAGLLHLERRRLGETKPVTETGFDDNGLYREKKLGKFAVNIEFVPRGVTATLSWLLPTERESLFNYKLTTQKGKPLSISNFPLFAKDPVKPAAEGLCELKSKSSAAKGEKDLAISLKCEDCGIKVKLSVITKFHVDFFTLKEIGVDFSVSATVATKLNFEAEGSFTVKGMIAVFKEHKKLGTITIPVGPVPIPVEIFFGLDITPSLTISGKVKIENVGFNATGALSFGFLYREGQGNPFHGTGSLNAVALKPELSLVASVDLKMMIEPVLTLRFAKSFNVQAKLSPYIGLEATFPYKEGEEGGCGSSKLRLWAYRGCKLYFAIQAPSITVKIPLWGYEKKLEMTTPWLPAKFSWEITAKKALTKLSSLTLPACIKNAAVKPKVKPKRRLLTAEVVSATLSEAASVVSVASSSWASGPRELAALRKIPDLSLYRAFAAAASQDAMARARSVLEADETIELPPELSKTSTSRLSAESSSFARLSLLRSLAAAASVSVASTLGTNSSAAIADTTRAGLVAGALPRDGRITVELSAADCKVRGGCLIVATPWGPCDAACGPAVRRRELACLHAPSQKRIPLAVCAAGVAVEGTSLDDAFAALSALLPAVRACNAQDNWPRLDGAVPVAGGDEDEADDRDKNSAYSSECPLGPVSDSASAAPVRLIPGSMAAGLHRTAVSIGASDGGGQCQGDAATTTGVAFSVPLADVKQSGSSLAVCTHGVALVSTLNGEATAADLFPPPTVSLAQGQGAPLVAPSFAPAGMLGAFPAFATGAADIALLHSLGSGDSRIGLRAVTSSRCIVLSAESLASVAGSGDLSLNLPLPRCWRNGARVLIAASAVPFLSLPAAEGRSVALSLKPGSDTAVARVRLELPAPPAAISSQPVGFVLVARPSSCSAEAINASSLATDARLTTCAENALSIHVSSDGWPEDSDATLGASVDDELAAIIAGADGSFWPYNKHQQASAPGAALGSALAWADPDLASAAVKTATGSNTGAVSAVLPIRPAGSVPFTVTALAACGTTCDVRLRSLPVFDLSTGASPVSLQRIAAEDVLGTAGKLVSLHIARSPHSSATSLMTFDVSFVAEPPLPEQCMPFAPALVVSVSPGEASLRFREQFTVSLQSQQSIVVSQREPWFEPTLTLGVSVSPSSSSGGAAPSDDCLSRFRAAKFAYSLSVEPLQALPPHARKELQLPLQASSLKAAPLLFSLGSSVGAAQQGCVSSRGGNSGSDEYVPVDDLAPDFHLFSVTGPLSVAGSPVATNVAIGGSRTKGSIGCQPPSGPSASVGTTIPASGVLSSLLPASAVGGCSTDAAVLELSLQTVSAEDRAALPVCPLNAAPSASSSTSDAFTLSRTGTRTSVTEDAFLALYYAPPPWLSQTDPLVWIQTAPEPAEAQAGRGLLEATADAGQGESPEAAAADQSPEAPPAASVPPFDPAAPLLRAWQPSSASWAPVSHSSLTTDQGVEATRCASAFAATAAGKAARDSIPVDSAPACSTVALFASSGSASGSFGALVALQIPAWSSLSVAIASTDSSMPIVAALRYSSESTGGLGGTTAEASSLRAANCFPTPLTVYVSIEGSATASSSSDLDRRVAVIFSTASGKASGMTLDVLATEGRKEAAQALSMSLEAIASLRNSSTVDPLSPSGCLRAAFRWQVGDWNACDAVCGEGGVEKRTVWCADAASGAAASSEICERAGLHRPLSSRQCSSGSCKFTPGPWSSCSPRCGVMGNRTRDWECRNRDGQGNEVDHWRCGTNRPVEDASWNGDVWVEASPCPSVAACAPGANYMWRTKAWSPCEPFRTLATAAALSSSSSSATASLVGWRRRAVECVAVPAGDAAPLLSSDEFFALPSQPSMLCAGTPPRSEASCAAQPAPTLPVTVRHVPVLSLNSRRRFALYPQQAASFLLPVREMIASSTAAKQPVIGVCLRVQAENVKSSSACTDVDALNPVRACLSALTDCTRTASAGFSVASDDDGDRDFASTEAGNATSAVSAAAGGVNGAAIATCFAQAQACLPRSVCNVALTAEIAEALERDCHRSAAGVAAQVATGLAAAAPSGSPEAKAMAAFALRLQNACKPLPRSEWKSVIGVRLDDESAQAKAALIAPSLGVFASALTLAAAGSAAPGGLAGDLFAQDTPRPAYPSSPSSSTWYGYSSPSLPLRRGSETATASLIRRPAFAYLPVFSAAQSSSPLRSLPSFDLASSSHLFAVISNSEGGSRVGLRTKVDVEATPLLSASGVSAVRAVLGGSLVDTVRQLGHIPDTLLAAGGLTITLTLPPHSCDEWLIPSNAAEASAGYWSTALRLLTAAPLLAVNRSSATPIGAEASTAAAPGSWAAAAAPLLSRGGLPLAVSFEIVAPSQSASTLEVAAGDAALREDANTPLSPDVAHAAALVASSASEFSYGSERVVKYGLAAVTTVTITLPPLPQYAPPSDEELFLAVPGEFLASSVDAPAAALSSTGDVLPLRVKATRKACVLSEWSDFSPCAFNPSERSRTAGLSRSGVSIRTRAVLQQPGSSAQACPPLQESRPCVFLPAPSSTSATSTQQASSLERAIAEGAAVAPLVSGNGNGAVASDPETMSRLRQARAAAVSLQQHRESLLKELRQDSLSCLVTPCASQGICIAGSCLCPDGYGGEDCGAPPPPSAPLSRMQESERSQSCFALQNERTLTFLRSTEASPAREQDCRSKPALGCLLSGGASVASNSRLTCPFVPPSSPADNSASTILVRFPLRALVMASPELRIAAQDAVVRPLSQEKKNQKTSAAAVKKDPLALDSVILGRLAHWTRDVLSSLLAASPSTASLLPRVTAVVDVSGLKLSLVPPASSSMPAGSDAAALATAAEMIQTAVDENAPGTATPLLLSSFAEIQLSTAAESSATLPALAFAARSAIGQLLKTLSCKPSMSALAGGATGPLLRRAGAATDAASQAQVAFVAQQMLCSPSTEAEVTAIQLAPSSPSTSANKVSRLASAGQDNTLAQLTLPAGSLVHSRASMDVVLGSLDPTDGLRTLLPADESEGKATLGLSARLLSRPVGISAIAVGSVALGLLAAAALAWLSPLCKAARRATSTVAVPNPLRAATAQKNGAKKASARGGDRSRSWRPTPLVLSLASAALVVAFIALLFATLAEASSVGGARGSSPRSLESRSARKREDEPFSPPHESRSTANALNELHSRLLEAHALSEADDEAGSASRALLSDEQKRLAKAAVHSAPLFNDGFSSRSSPPRRTRRLQLDEVKGQERRMAEAMVEAGGAEEEEEDDPVASYMRRLNNVATRTHAAHVADRLAAASDAGDAAANGHGRRLFYTSSEADSSQEWTLRTLQPLSYVPQAVLPSRLGYDATFHAEVVHLDAGIGGESHPLLLRIDCAASSSATALAEAEARMTAEELFAETEGQRRARRTAQIDSFGRMKMHVLLAPAPGDESSSAATLMNELRAGLADSPHFTDPSEWGPGHVLVGDSRWGCWSPQSEAMGGEHLPAPFYREVSSLRLSGQYAQPVEGSAAVMIGVFDVEFVDVPALSLFESLSVTSRSQKHDYNWTPDHEVHGTPAVPFPIFNSAAHEEALSRKLAEDEDGSENAVERTNGTSRALDRRLWGGTIGIDKTKEWKPEKPTLFENNWLKVTCDNCFAKIRAGFSFSLEGKWFKLQKLDAHVFAEPAVRFALKAEISASYTWTKEWNFLSTTLVVVTLPISIVVIPIPLKLRLGFEASVTASARLTLSDLGFEASFFAKAGIKYDGNFGTYTEGQPTLTILKPKLEIAGQLTARAGPVVALVASPFDVWPIEGAALPYAQFLAVTPAGSACSRPTDISVRLQYGVDLRFKIDTPKIWKLEIKISGLPMTKTLTLVAPKDLNLFGLPGCWRNKLAEFAQSLMDALNLKLSELQAFLDTVAASASFQTGEPPTNGQVDYNPQATEFSGGYVPIVVASDGPALAQAASSSAVRGGNSLGKEFVSGKGIASFTGGQLELPAAAGNTGGTGSIGAALSSAIKPAAVPSPKVDLATVLPRPACGSTLPSSSASNTPRPSASSSSTVAASRNPAASASPTRTSAASPAAKKLACDYYGVCSIASSSLLAGATQDYASSAVGGTKGGITAAMFARSAERRRLTAASLGIHEDDHDASGQEDQEQRVHRRLQALLEDEPLSRVEAALSEAASSPSLPSRWQALASRLLVAAHLARQTNRIQFAVAAVPDKTGLQHFRDLRLAGSDGASTPAGRYLLDAASSLSSSPLQGTSCAAPNACSYEVEPWGPCDAVCGPAVRTREVHCRFNGTGGLVPVENCALSPTAGLLPASSQLCSFLPSCGVYTEFTNTSSCDAQASQQAGGHAVEVHSSAGCTYVPSVDAYVRFLCGSPDTATPASLHVCGGDPFCRPESCGIVHELSLTARTCFTPVLAPLGALSARVSCDAAFFTSNLLLTAQNDGKIANTTDLFSDADAASGFSLSGSSDVGPADALLLPSSGSIVRSIARTSRVPLAITASQAAAMRLAESVPSLHARLPLVSGSRVTKVFQAAVPSADVADALFVTVMWKAIGANMTNSSSVPAPVVTASFDANKLFPLTAAASVNGGKTLAVAVDSPVLLEKRVPHEKLTAGMDAVSMLLSSPEQGSMTNTSAGSGISGVTAIVDGAAGRGWTPGTGRLYVGTITSSADLLWSVSAVPMTTLRAGASRLLRCAPGRTLFAAHVVSDGSSGASSSSGGAASAAASAANARMPAPKGVTFLLEPAASAVAPVGSDDDNQAAADAGLERLAGLPARDRYQLRVKRIASASSLAWPDASDAGGEGAQMGLATWWLRRAANPRNSLTLTTTFFGPGAFSLDSTYTVSVECGAFDGMLRLAAVPILEGPERTAAKRDLDDESVAGASGAGSDGSSGGSQTAKIAAVISGDAATSAASADAAAAAGASAAGAPAAGTTSLLKGIESGGFAAFTCFVDPSAHVFTVRVRAVLAPSAATDESARADKAVALVKAATGKGPAAASALSIYLSAGAPSFDARALQATPDNDGWLRLTVSQNSPWWSDAFTLVVAAAPGQTAAGLSFSALVQAASFTVASEGLPFSTVLSSGQAAQRSLFLAVPTDASAAQEAAKSLRTSAMANDRMRSADSSALHRDEVVLLSWLPSTNPPRLPTAAAADGAVDSAVSPLKLRVSIVAGSESRFFPAPPEPQAGKQASGQKQEESKALKAGLPFANGQESDGQTLGGALGGELTFVSSKKARASDVAAALASGGKLALSRNVVPGAAGKEGALSGPLVLALGAQLEDDGSAAGEWNDKPGSRLEATAATTGSLAWSSTSKSDGASSGAGVAGNGNSVEADSISASRRLRILSSSSSSSSADATPRVLAESSRTSSAQDLAVLLERDAAVLSSLASSASSSQTAGGLALYSLRPPSSTGKSWSPVAAFPCNQTSADVNGLSTFSDAASSARCFRVAISLQRTRSIGPLPSYSFSPASRSLLFSLPPTSLARISVASAGFGVDLAKSADAESGQFTVATPASGAAGALAPFTATLAHGAGGNLAFGLSSDASGSSVDGLEPATKKSLEGANCFASSSQPLFLSLAPALPAQAVATRRVMTAARTESTLGDVASGASVTLLFDIAVVLESVDASLSRTGAEGLFETRAAVSRGAATCAPLRARFAWAAGAWGEPSSRCGIATQARKVVCVDMSLQASSAAADEGGNAAVSDAAVTNDFACLAVHGKAPSSRRVVDLGACRPVLSDWSPCSTTCGPGKQYRSVMCLNRNGTGEEAPLAACSSNAAASGASLQDPSTLSRACADYRGCPQVNSPAGRDGLVAIVPADPSSPSSASGDAIFFWASGEWSPCDRKCGPGKRTRPVLCKTQNRLPSGALTPAVVAPQAACKAVLPGAQPDSVQACNRGDCPLVPVSVLWSRVTHLAPSVPLSVDIPGRSVRLLAADRTTQRQTGVCVSIAPAAINVLPACSSSASIDLPGQCMRGLQGCLSRVSGPVPVRAVDVSQYGSDPNLGSAMTANATDIGDRNGTLNAPALAPASAAESSLGEVDYLSVVGVPRWYGDSGAALDKAAVLGCYVDAQRCLSLIPCTAQAIVDAAMATRAQCLVSAIDPAAAAQCNPMPSSVIFGKDAATGADRLDALLNATISVAAAADLTPSTARLGRLPLPEERAAALQAAVFTVSLSAASSSGGGGDGLPPPPAFPPSLLSRFPVYTTVAKQARFSSSYYDPVAAARTPSPLSIVFPLTFSRLGSFDGSGYELSSLVFAMSAPDVGLKLSVTATPFEEEATLRGSWETEELNTEAMRNPTITDDEVRLNGFSFALDLACDFIVADPNDPELVEAGVTGPVEQSEALASLGAARVSAAAMLAGLRGRPVDAGKKAATSAWDSQVLPGLLKGAIVSSASNSSTLPLSTAVVLTISTGGTGIRAVIPPQPQLQLKNGDEALYLTVPGRFLQSGRDLSLPFPVVTIIATSRSCVVSPFGAWSPCSATACVKGSGGSTNSSGALGTQKRTRSIITPPAGSGQDCPPLEETRFCSACSPCAGVACSPAGGLCISGRCVCSGAWAGEDCSSLPVPGAAGGSKRGRRMQDGDSQVADPVVVSADTAVGWRVVSPWTSCLSVSSTSSSNSVAGGAVTSQQCGTSNSASSSEISAAAAAAGISADSPLPAQALKAGTLRRLSTRAVACIDAASGQEVAAQRCTATGLSRPSESRACPTSIVGVLRLRLPLTAAASIASGSDTPDASTVSAIASSLSDPSIMRSVEDDLIGALATALGVAEEHVAVIGPAFSNATNSNSAGDAQGIFVEVHARGVNVTRALSQLAELPSTTTTTTTSTVSSNSNEAIALSSLLNGQAAGSICLPSAVDARSLVAVTAASTKATVRVTTSAPASTSTTTLLSSTDEGAGPATALMLRLLLNLYTAAAADPSYLAATGATAVANDRTRSWAYGMLLDAAASAASSSSSSNQGGGLAVATVAAADPVSDPAADVPVSLWQSSSLSLSNTVRSYRYTEPNAAWSAAGVDPNAVTGSTDSAALSPSMQLVVGLAVLQGLLTIALVVGIWWIVQRRRSSLTSVSSFAAEPLKPVIVAASRSSIKAPFSVQSPMHAAGGDGSGTAAQRLRRALSSRSAALFSGPQDGEQSAVAATLMRTTRPSSAPGSNPLAVTNTGTVRNTRTLLSSTSGSGKGDAGSRETSPRRPVAAFVASPTPAGMDVFRSPRVGYSAAAAAEGHSNAGRNGRRPSRRSQSPYREDVESKEFDGEGNAHRYARKQYD